MIIEKATKSVRWATSSNELFVWMAVLTAFCIPLLKHGIALPIILLLLSWCFAPKQSLHVNGKAILLFSGLYFFHIVGMAYTENVSRGLTDLEQKFSLLLMPVLFGTVETLRKKQIWLILWSFFFGTLLSVLISFCTSWWSYQISHDIEEFYRSNFSPSHHPTYLAMYMNFSIWILLYFILREKRKTIIEVLCWLAILFLSLSLLFPASKLGLINFFVIPVFGLFTARQKGIFFSWRSATLIGISSLFVFSLLANQMASTRIKGSVEVLTRGGKQEKAHAVESNQARLIVWEVAVKEIVKYPFGVGTGDINDVLVETYRKQGYLAIADMGLNPHNTFLQIGLAQGVLAVLWFIYSLFFVLKRIVAQYLYVYAFFMISMLLNFMTESILEKEAGVVFFTFFNAVFFFGNSQKANVDELN